MKSGEIDLNARLKIEKLGARGEGVARNARGLVFVPYALAGETVLAEVDGERGKLVDVLEASPDRIAPFCRYYGDCGGCTVQTLRQDAYLAWKRGLLADALANAHIDAPVRDAVDAHGAGRRRVTFHARFGFGAPQVGFMRARAHDIVDIDACPLLEPALAEAPMIARDVARALNSLGKPLDIAITSTDGGLDVDLRGAGPLPFDLSQKLVALAATRDLARVSNHGIVVIERRLPHLKIGRADLVLPPGAFLQATKAGEDALAALVLSEARGARRVADLFSGVGTFALHLAKFAEVHAVEQDSIALAALTRAAHNAQGLKRVTTEARDLFKRPLMAGELSGFDCVVFDPPRSGAEAQARELAASIVPLVVAVSCNVMTFARDANILIEGGYELTQATPVDQFRHSPHVETVAAFRRAARKGKAKRGLLSR